MSNKSLNFAKNKFAVSFLIVPIIFSLTVGVALAEGGGTVPSTPIASPTGTPTGAGYPTMDFGTISNTNLIVRNTYSIASTLTGLTPGAQQDQVKANIGMIVIKRVLREITKATVKWINSGFEGNPSFITNTQQWLTDTADITIGDFLMNDPALNFLCDPFKVQIKLALGFQYRPFQEQIKCSFTSALGNVNDAYNKFINGDFIGGGGWDSWLKMSTTPQNNQMGAMILSQAELDARLAGSTHQAELEANWGGGFLSWKKCTDSTGNNSYGLNSGTVNRTVATNNGATTTASNTGSNCTIQTPGSAIASVIPYFSTDNIRQAEVAQDLNEIANALMNQILSQGMEMFKGSGLLGAGKTNANTAKTDYTNYLTNLERQQAAAQGLNLGSDGSGFTFDNTNNGGAGVSNSNAKTAAIARVNNQKAIEQSYQQNVNAVLNLLYNAYNSAYKAFSAQQNCNYLVRSNVLDRIDGTKAYDTTMDGNRLTFNENLNKPALEQLLNKSNDDINSLNTLMDNINSSNADDSVITSAVSQGVNNNINMHTQQDVDSFAVGGSRYVQIKSWLSTMQSNYKATNDVCKADLSAWGL